MVSFPEGFVRRQHPLGLGTECWELPAQLQPHSLFQFPSSLGGFDDLGLQSRWQLPRGDWGGSLKLVGELTGSERGSWGAPALLTPLGRDKA